MQLIHKMYHRIQGNHFERMNVLKFTILVLGLTCCNQQPDVIRDVNAYKRTVDDNPDMQLINLREVIPDAIFDIRYATDNNFTGQVIYKTPFAYARAPVASALRQLQDSLQSLGLSLVVFDAYRPYSATVLFYKVFPDSRFVADPRYGSRHNRGCAVDVTLANSTTGEYLPMPTEFDDFTEQAHPDFPHVSDTVKSNRTRLIDLMDYYGFSVYPSEWWHFDYNGWEAYPLMDVLPEDI